MKTEPDGWTEKEWQKSIKYTGDICICERKEVWGDTENIPVCLVPPELIDWVEGVKSFLKTTIECSPNPKNIPDEVFFQIERELLSELSAIQEKGK